MVRALLICLSLCSVIAATISEKNLRFVDYPGFPEAGSTWGSIGYSSVHKKVFAGVTNLICSVIRPMMETMRISATRGS